MEDEGPRVVNSCHELRSVVCEQHAALTKAREEALANSVPAAAVIQRVRTLFGITGLKAYVGGATSVG